MALPQTPGRRRERDMIGGHGFRDRRRNDDDAARDRDRSPPRNRQPPLTQEERDFRLQNNLCFICGEKDHQRDACPKAFKNQGRNKPAWPRNPPPPGPAPPGRRLAAMGTGTPDFHYGQ